MTRLDDGQIYSLECQLIAFIAGAMLVAVLVRKLKRSRPGFAIGNAVFAAFIVRIFAALGLDQTPVAQELRGGDELTFLARAHDVALTPITSQLSTDMLTTQFHTFIFSLNNRALGEVPDMMLRFELITFAVIGLALLSATVYELAGAKAAVITAWIVGLEPTNVFFSGILHKEPLMFMAEGMVAFGGAVLWKRGDLRALAPMVVGCLIATATRPYVGWFLASAAAGVALHASLRRGSASRSLALSVVMLALMGTFVPVVWSATSKESLEELQSSQDANAADDEANLSLESVDYSSRGNMIVNLPQRLRDVVLRPYPWQVANTSQQLGVIGTLVMFIGLMLLIAALLQNGGAVMRRAGPLVYPMLFMLVAYSLSAGNAGTAFRYRTHLVAIMLALLVVLRQQRSEARADVLDRRDFRPLSPMPKARVTA